MHIMYHCRGLGRLRFGYLTSTSGFLLVWIHFNCSSIYIIIVIYFPIVRLFPRVSLLPRVWLPPRVHCCKLLQTPHTHQSQNQALAGHVTVYLSDYKYITNVRIVIRLLFVEFRLLSCHIDMPYSF